MYVCRNSEQLVRQAEQYSPIPCTNCSGSDAAQAAAVAVSRSQPHTKQPKHALAQRDEHMTHHNSPSAATN
jgi:hypothetical protein